MFYKQLLRTQIQNAQKRQSSQQCRLALLGPTSIKAAHKMLVKLTPGLAVNYATYFYSIGGRKVQEVHVAEVENDRRELLLRLDGRCVVRDHAVVAENGRMIVVCVVEQHLVVNSHLSTFKDY